MSNKPTVRFNGYTDVWLKQKLDDIVSYYNGLTYTPNDVRDEGTLVLRSSNVQNGEIVDADNVYVTPEAVNVGNVRLGDIIVVVRNGSRALLGKHAEVKADTPNTVIGAFMTGMRSECPSFTNALLDTKHFEEEIALNLGATINQITGYMFSQMEFITPTTLDERKKLGVFFGYIDRLLELHQHKLNTLLSVRKSMLQKMFPRNGSKVPEIRFKGFDGEWEEKTFGELYTKINVKNDLSYGVESIISVANMYYKPDSTITNYDYLRTYNIFLPGDIAFEGNKSKHFAHGRFVENSIGPGIVSHVFDVFRPKGDFDLLFWKYLINYEPIMGPKLVRCTKASTMMTNLVAEDFLKESILVPNVSEQKRIGEFLAHIDKLVEIYESKLAALKKVKQSLLAKMFV